MLLFRDMTGEPKAQLIRAMQQCNINPKDYDTVGNTIIQIICMEISGKPVTIQYTSIRGILNLSVVLIALLKELKGEETTASDSALRNFMRVTSN